MPKYHLTYWPRTGGIPVAKADDDNFWKQYERTKEGEFPNDRAASGWALAVGMGCNSDGTLLERVCDNGVRYKCFVSPHGVQLDADPPMINP